MPSEARGPRLLVVLLTAAAFLLVLSGCLNASQDPVEADPQTPVPPKTSSTNTTTEASSPANTTNGSASSATGTNGSAELPPPSLPANVSLQDGRLVERTRERAVFAWNATIPRGADDPEDDAPRTRLTVPPDRWLKVNVSVRWNETSRHVAPVIEHRDVSWCLSLGSVGEPDTSSYRSYLAESREASCTVRPDPRNALEPWELTVDHFRPGTDATGLEPVEPVPIEVRVAVTAMRGPYGDLRPAEIPEGWPSLEEAPLRPGAKLGSGTCTTNFLFSSPGNASLYLGTANHCVDQFNVGTTVPIAGIPRAGRIAYCGWDDQQRNRFPGCPSPRGFPANDFALIELRPDLRDRVHPAVHEWGGPTGLAANASVGEDVLAFGNTVLRDANQPQVPERLDRQQGHVAASTEWITYANLAPPATKGDSGGPVLLGEGRALGVMRSDELCVADRDGIQHRSTNGVTNLAASLARLENRTDLEVELVTWPLSSSSALPGPPVDPTAGPQVCAEP